MFNVINNAINEVFNSKPSVRKKGYYVKLYKYPSKHYFDNLKDAKGFLFSYKGDGYIAKKTKNGWSYFGEKDAGIWKTKNFRY